MPNNKQREQDPNELMNINFKVPFKMKQAFLGRCAEDRETISSMLRKLMDDYTHRRIEYITNIEIRDQ